MMSKLKKFAPFILAVLAVTLIPNIAHAEGAVTCSFTNPLTWPTCLAFGASYIVGALLGAVLIIVAWVFEIVLAVNQNVINATSVRVGFSVTLGLANLGFIFGIIVIAIATIIRYQTYGLKQILWKLVVMAILINFSMTIAGTIIGFANDLSQYFMSQATPSGVAGSFGGFVKNFVAGLSPQRGVSATWNPLLGGLGVFGDPAGVIGAIASSYISVLFAAVTVIVLGAMVLMLLVRYIALGILLVLMPLAWLCWVFPDLKSNWNRWWHAFLRWTFFAPLLMFFIYLALAAWTKRSDLIDTTALKENSESAAQVFNSETGVFGAVKGFFANITDDIAQQVLIVGLMVGGLFAANSLGIMGASAAMGAATGVAKGFGSYAVGRPARGLGRQAAGLAARRTGIAGVADRLQKWASAPGRGRVGRFMGGLAARPAAQLAAAGGENLVKQYEKEVANMSRGEMMSAALTAMGPRRIALQKKLAAMGEFDLKQTHTEANQRLWEAHGMKQAYNKEVEIPSGMSAEVYQLKKKQEAGDKSVTDETIQQKYDEFLRGLTKADVSKMAVKDIMSTNERGEPKEALGESSKFVGSFRSHFVRGMVNAAPDNISSVLPKFRGSQLNTFQKEAEGHIDEQLQRIRQQLDPADVTSELERIATREKRNIEEFLKLDKETWSKIEGVTEEKINTFRRLADDTDYKRLTKISKKLEGAVGANAVFGAPETGGGLQPPPSGIPKSPTGT